MHSTRSQMAPASVAISRMWPSGCAVPCAFLPAWWSATCINLSRWTCTPGSRLSLAGGGTHLTRRRRNLEASLSDGSVLAGIGPHEISPLVEVFGVPIGCACQGTEHRVTFQLEWATGKRPNVVADVELDWLAETRQRFFKVNNTVVDVPDLQEPLIREAQAFIDACRGIDRERWLDDAENVTAVLERLERLRKGP